MDSSRYFVVKIVDPAGKCLKLWLIFMRFVRFSNVLLFDASR